MPEDIRGFSHIVIKVADLDATIDFYTRHLGFKLLRRYQMRTMESGYLELGGVLLELFPRTSADGPVDPQDNPIGLEVTDLDAVLSRLKQAGIECGEPYSARTFWGRQAKIRDNSGYLVSLRQYDAPDGPAFDDWQPRHDDVQRLDA
jgi:catechol 2,3-dioxygenase-like lactoylglutathione lyase family enzyme